VNPNDSKETPFGAREIWCVLRDAANEQNGASEGALAVAESFRLRALVARMAGTGATRAQILSAVRAALER
jgi:hypothetical protein